MVLSHETAQKTQNRLRRILKWLLVLILVWPVLAWVAGRGLIVSAAGFAVQKSGFGVHQHFNHNDIYHLIQIVGFWCLYEGVRRM